MFAAEITIACESIRKGCTFVARFYDRDTQQFYGGDGPTALEALAWCMDDYVSRAVLGLPHTMAMPSDARPGWRFHHRPPLIVEVPTVMSRIETQTNASRPRSRKRGKKVA